MKSIGTVDNEGIRHTTRPLFTKEITTAGSDKHFLRYSKDFGILSCAWGNTNGLQFFHIGYQLDRSLHKSTEFDCDSPEDAYYIQNGLLPSGEKVHHVADNDSDVTYVNGSGEVWSDVGADAPAKIARDATGQGYLEWENIIGREKAGVVFVPNDNGGGAKVTVTDETTSQVLSDWDGVSIDLWYDEDATAGGAGTWTDESVFVCWINLSDISHTYTVKVEHSGTDNGGPNDYLAISHYLLVKSLNDATVGATLLTRHEDHSTPVLEYELTPGGNDLVKSAAFNGDSSTTTFSLSGDQRAVEPVEISKDGGTTWLTPNSYQLTWGSNSPDYDNEQDDSNGYFAVKFTTAPDTGTDNVIIRYRPKADTYYVRTKINLPGDNADYVESTKVVRLQDHAVEII
jgi:hypothetical protein